MLPGGSCQHWSGQRPAHRHQRRHSISDRMFGICEGGPAAGVNMTVPTRAVRSPFLLVVLLVTVAWSIAPFAGQDNATTGFIYFTSDRAFPSELGMCDNCEDIYVMSPDGTNA